jgi:hypothetical protein
MRLGNAVVVPSTSFADLMARAPVFNKTPFMEVVGANAGMTAGLAGQVLNNKTQLGAAQIQAQALTDVERIRRKASQPTAGDRLRAIAPSLLDSFQNVGTNRFAGQLLNVGLAEGTITPGDLIGMVNGVQASINDNRALQFPWISGSQEGARKLLKGA